MNSFLPPLSFVTPLVLGPHTLTAVVHSPMDKGHYTPFPSIFQPPASDIARTPISRVLRMPRFLCTFYAPATTLDVTQLHLCKFTLYRNALDPPVLCFSLPPGVVYLVYMFSVILNPLAI